MNHSAEIAALKKQMANVLERLDMLVSAINAMPKPPKSVAEMQREHDEQWRKHLDLAAKGVGQPVKGARRAGLPWAEAEGDDEATRDAKRYNEMPEGAEPAPRVIPDRKLDPVGYRYGKAAEKIEGDIAKARAKRREAEPKSGAPKQKSFRQYARERVEEAQRAHID